MNGTTNELELARPSANPHGAEYYAAFLETRQAEARGADLRVIERLRRDERIAARRVLKFGDQHRTDLGAEESRKRYLRNVRQQQMRVAAERISAALETAARPV